MEILKLVLALGLSLTRSVSSVRVGGFCYSQGRSWHLFFLRKSLQALFPPASMYESCVSSHLSIVMDLTKLMWTPSPLCFPLQSMQKKIPRFTDAQSTLSFDSQSTHRWLYLHDLTTSSLALASCKWRHRISPTCLSGWYDESCLPCPLHLPPSLPLSLHSKWRWRSVAVLLWRGYSSRVGQEEGGHVPELATTSRPNHDGPAICRLRQIPTSHKAVLVLFPLSVPGRDEARRTAAGMKKSCLAISDPTPAKKMWRPVLSGLSLL